MQQNWKTHSGATAVQVGTRNMGGETLCSIYGGQSKSARPEGSICLPGSQSVLWEASHTQEGSWPQIFVLSKEGRALGCSLKLPGGGGWQGFLSCLPCHHCPFPASWKTQRWEYFIKKPTCDKQLLIYKPLWELSCIVL